MAHRIYIFGDVRRVAIKAEGIFKHWITFISNNFATFFHMSYYASKA